MPKKEKRADRVMREANLVIRSWIRELEREQRICRRIQGAFVSFTLQMIEGGFWKPTYEELRAIHNHIFDPED
jgi:hypothetical protein